MDDKRELCLVQDAVLVEEVKQLVGDPRHHRLPQGVKERDWSKFSNLRLGQWDNGAKLERVRASSIEDRVSNRDEQSEDVVREGEEVLARDTGESFVRRRSQNHRAQVLQTRQVSRDRRKITSHGVNLLCHEGTCPHCACHVWRLFHFAHDAIDLRLARREPRLSVQRRTPDGQRWPFRLLELKSNTLRDLEGESALQCVYSPAHPCCVPSDADGGGATSLRLRLRARSKPHELAPSLQRPRRPLASLQHCGQVPLAPHFG